MTAKINENTTIPLVAVICTIPFLVGAIMWLSSVDAKATKGAEAKEILIQMAQDVAVIKADVSYLKEKK